MSSKLSVGNAKAIQDFNKRHKANPPLDIIHDEIALRMYPYLKDSYLETKKLMQHASTYCRCSGKVLLPKSDNIHSLTQLTDVAHEIAYMVKNVKRFERPNEEHTAMKVQMDIAAASYQALAAICVEALIEKFL